MTSRRILRALVRPELAATLLVGLALGPVALTGSAQGQAPAPAGQGRGIIPAQPPEPARPTPQQPSRNALEPPQAPILRVEAGTHLAPVRRLATDSAGRVLATVSDDKTLRLWSLPDGAPRGVLRPPIGAEAEGELYAVALTPDGGRAFAAGYTARSWDGALRHLCLRHRAPGALARCCRACRRRSAAPRRLARGHAARRRPRGARRDAGLGCRAPGARPARIPASAARPAWLAFDRRQGRLAVTSADGRVRVYDPGGRKLAERVPVAGARPYGIAFSPDGALLAVGYEDRLRVELLAASDLRTVFVARCRRAWPARACRPSPGRRTGRGACSSCRRLCARAQSAAPAPHAQRRHRARLRRQRRRRGGGSGAASSSAAGRISASGPPPTSPPRATRSRQSAALPGGGLVYAAADPGWGRVAPDGSLAIAPRPPRRWISATPDSPWRSRRKAPGCASRCARANDRSSSMPRIGRLAVADADTGGVFLPPRTDRHAGADPGLAEHQPPAPRPGGAAPGRGRVLPQPRPAAAGRRLRCSAPTRICGCSTRRPAARCRGPAGHRLGRDGRRERTGRGGARRRHGALVRPRSRRAPGRTGSAVRSCGRALRWVLWTPEGLFDHAPEGGQELVGVHLNRGRAQTPEWASFRQAYRALFAPAELRARLTGDAAPARARIAAARRHAGARSAACRWSHPALPARWWPAGSAAALLSPRPCTRPARDHRAAPDPAGGRIAASASAPSTSWSMTASPRGARRPR